MTVKSIQNPPKRRKFNHREHICESPECKISKGGNGCGKVYTTKSMLKLHLDPKRYECFCGKSYSQKGNLDTHKFKKHGIPMSGTKPIPYPPGYNKDIFKFIKNKVRNCITNDKKKMNKEDWEFFNNNEQKHRLAKLLYEREIIQNKAHESLRDKLGGHLPNTLVLSEFGGIFQGSLDRIDRKQNHFVNTNDPISNVQLVPLGMNTSANLSNLHMGDTVEILKQKIKESEKRTQEEADSAIEFQKKTRIKVDGKWTDNTLYNSCHNSYKHDERCRAEFETRGAYFQHCLKILKEQNNRCAVSYIFFENHGTFNPFKISVDAIDPRLGHVPGNLRIIILALNCTVPIQDENLEYPDVPTQWFRDVFLRYIGI